MNRCAAAKKADNRCKARFSQGFIKDDNDSRNSFVEHHLPLVISIAKKYVNQGIEFEDLVQDGTLGLITAAGKFDPLKGFRFSTYATWWIRQAIEESILKQGDNVKKPSNYSSHLKHLLKVTHDLEEKLGRAPTSQEVSQDADMDQRMVRQLLSLIPGTVSLDAPIADIDDSAGNYLDVLEDRDAVSPDEKSIFGQLREDLGNALSALTEKERRIIEMRYGLKTGESQSLREIGRLFSLSPERIRQIEEGAISKLRESAHYYSLKEYLN